MPDKGRPIYQDQPPAAFGFNLFLAVALVILFVALVVVTRAAHGEVIVLDVERAILPPPQYDHPYLGGKVLIHRLSDWQARRRCEMVGLGPVDGCAYIHGGRDCHVVVSTARPAQVQSTVVRHEVAHCNGWPADHPGGR
jgi:hypothetical protein